MHITQVSATALKGRSFSHALTERVLVTGKNASGKTAIVEAVRLALLGHIPELGKTNAATFGLCSAGVMNASVTMSDGATITRQFAIKGDAVNASTMTGLDDEEIASLASPLLDASHYFALTEAERIRYIYARGLAGDGSSDVQTIIAEIAALDGAAEAKGVVAGVVREAFAHAPTFADALNVLNAPKGKLATELAYCKKRAKETLGAVRVLSELKTREPECSADRLSDLDRERKVIEAKVRAASEEHGRRSQAIMAANKAAGRRDEITQKLADLERTPPPDLAVIESNYLKVKEEYKKISSEPTEQALSAIHGEKSAVAIRAGEAVKTATAEVHHIEEEIAALDHLKACPFCASKGKTWKATLEKQLLDKQQKAGVELAACEKIVLAANNERDHAAEVLSRRRAELQKRTEIEKRGVEVRRILDTAKAEIALRAQTEHSLKAELENLPVPGPIAGLEDAAEAVTTAREELDAINQRLADAQALAQDLKRAAESEEEHQKAVDCAAAYAAAMELLKEKQRTQVDALFATVMQTANRFTDGILRADLVFRDGEIGMLVGSAFVSHETFSGMERAVTYIAINAALASKSKFRLAILDELGRVDEANKAKITLRLSNAVTDGLLDQVIVIDTKRETSEGATAWTHIAL